MGQFYNIYTISCSATSQYGDYQVEIAQRNISTLEVTALQPYTTYNCCVSAENIAGDGEQGCSEGNTSEDGKRCMEMFLFLVVNQFLE